MAEPQAGPVPTYSTIALAAHMAMREMDKLNAGSREIDVRFSLMSARQDFESGLTQIDRLLSIMDDEAGGETEHGS